MLRDTAGHPIRALPRWGWIGLLPLGVALTSCRSIEPLLPVDVAALLGRPPPEAARDESIYRSGQLARVRYLEREVERLQADLRQAEQAMVAIESGLRGVRSRADAVSELAEARIAVERAARAAPWRRSLVEQARGRLEEADRQLRAGHSGSAIFFASRGRRIAETLEEEARHVARATDARFVDRPRVNLRAGPSTEQEVLVVLERDTPVFPERSEGAWMLVRISTGPVGWVHASLLRDR